MTERCLIDVTDLLALGAGDPELETNLARELRGLADELNSSLDSYEVMLVHLDMNDFLSFERRDPTEGAYWRELEEERREAVEALIPPAEDDPHQSAWVFRCNLGLAQDGCGQYLADANSRGAMAHISGCPSCARRVPDNARTWQAEAAVAEASPDPARDVVYS